MKIYTPEDINGDDVVHRIYNYIRNILNWMYGGLLFFFENTKIRYKHVLIGEKHNSHTGETILQYRVIGKKQIVEMSAKEMCNLKSIICNFHPLEIRIISFIAGADQILEIGEEKRADMFKKFKKNIFLR